MNALQLAIEHMGSQARLADALSVRQSAVANWLSRGVPVKRAVDIERATGGAVTRYELRPDIFGERPGVAA